MFSIQMHGLVPQPKLEMTKIFSLLIETIFLVVSLLTTVGANYYFATANPSMSWYVNYITCMRFYKIMLSLSLSLVDTIFDTIATNCFGQRRSRRRGLEARNNYYKAD